MTPCQDSCHCSARVSLDLSPVRPEVPATGDVTASLFAIPGMDCPAEERLIRLALQDTPGLAGLEFDLGRRELRVMHTGPLALVAQPLGQLGLGARLVSSGPEAAVAALGFAHPPYQHWTWIDLQLRMGAPKLVHLPAEERLVATVRLYHPVRTALCEIEPLSCRLTRVGALAETSWRAAEIVPLPSAGDTGGAGMVVRDGHLFISYHSSHAAHTRVFLAVMAVPYPPPL